MTFSSLEKENTVTLTKFQGQFVLPAHASQEWFLENREFCRKALFVDVETTGLKINSDRVIEIGLRQAVFDIRTGEIVSIGNAFSGLEDPKVELSEKVKRITGLSNSDLAGQTIDWAMVCTFFQGADIIIAHNARFDRNYLDRAVPISASKIWACSSSQVDWYLKGYSTNKLELLNHFHGFYVDSHRALNDADNIAHLLSFRDLSNGRPYLFELLNTARQRRSRITAIGAPYEVKDTLKERGYSWNGTSRCWQAEVLEASVVDEIEWLEQHAYQGVFHGKVEPIRLCDTFKS